MASPQDAQKFLANNKMESFAKDADFSTAADIDEWVDMRDYGGIAVMVTGINLTGAGPSGLDIIADEDADGGDGNVIITTWSGDAATAEGDFLVLEATSEQIVQEGEDNSKNLRYVSVKLKLANAGDEAVVTYVRYNPRFPQLDLTADSVT